MKNKQFVEYSDNDKRFKIDQLLYLDVDSQSRAELIDLFGILSDNPMYKVLTKRSTTMYLLGGIFVLILMCFGTLYVQWYMPGKGTTSSNHYYDGNRRLLVGNTVPGHLERLLQNDSLNGTLADDSADFDWDDNNSTDSNPKGANDMQTDNPTSTPPKDPTGSPTENPPSSPTNTPTNNPKNSPTNTPNNTSTKTNTPSSPTGAVDDTPDDDTGYVDPDLENKVSTGSSYGFLYFLLILIAGCFASLAVIECRKRQIYRNLIVFEETTLKTFHSKVNNRIIISPCHEQIVVLSLQIFSIYSFKFLVHNNGTESESVNLSGSMQAPPSTQPLQSQLGNENSIYKVIEEEGEKYHNAVINLNKQLQNN